VSEEAILSADNSGKPLGGRGSAPNPAVSSQCSPDFLAGVKGLAAPPQEPHPTFGLSVLAPNEKS